MEKKVRLVGNSLAYDVALALKNLERSNAEGRMKDRNLVEGVKGWQPEGNSST